MNHDTAAKYLGVARSSVSNVQVVGSSCGRVQVVAHSASARLETKSPKVWGEMLRYRTETQRAQRGEEGTDE